MSMQRDRLIKCLLSSEAEKQALPIVPLAAKGAKMLFKRIIPIVRKHPGAALTGAFGAHEVGSGLARGIKQAPLRGVIQRTL